MLIVRHILLDNNGRPTFYMNCNYNEILYHRNKLKVRHLFVSYREKEKYGIVLKRLKKETVFIFCCLLFVYFVAHQLNTVSFTLHLYFILHRDCQ